MVPPRGIRLASPFHGSSAPPGGPPGPQNPGSRLPFEEAEILKFLVSKAPAIPSPLFRSTVNSLAHCARLEEEGKPSQVISQGLQQTASLLAVSAPEIFSIPEADHTMPASAAFVLGRLVLNNGEDRECVAHLFQSAAACADVADQDSSLLSAQDFLQHDHRLGEALLNLMGWLDEERLTAEQGETVASILCRLGILAGCLSWPAAGYDLPNIVGAVSILYKNDLDPDSLPKLKLRPASSYIESASRLRSKPLGAVERILSVFLDRALENALRVSKSLWKDVPYSIIADLHRYLDLVSAEKKGKGKQEILAELVKKSAPQFPSFPGRRINLPAFLKRALELPQ